MSSKRYTAEFRTEAIRQVTERGYPVREVAGRLGVSTYSLYKWLKGAGKTPRLVGQEDLRAENARLKAELTRRGGTRHPKKGRRVLCQGIRVRYAFVAAHRREFRLTTMCRVLRMHRSGFYAWLKSPQSPRAKEDGRILVKIRTSYQASDGVYGSTRVHRDLREVGERCGEHRVARLMRIHGLRAIRGYKKPRYRAGKPAVVAPNRLEQNFSVAAPDRVWATDITYVRTFEGWLYLAVVVDLYSRIVVGWSMKSALTRELVLDALLMAVWRRRPTQPVIVHSDQGSQYGSDDAVRFCKDHGLIPSMSRRGNCFDNAVVESFFSSLKKERIRRRIYQSREEARADVFDYIEVFYNQVRRHSHLGRMSPRDFEQAVLTPARRVSTKSGEVQRSDGDVEAASPSRVS